MRFYSRYNNLIETDYYLRIVRRLNIMGYLLTKNQNDLDSFGNLFLVMINRRLFDYGLTEGFESLKTLQFNFG